MLTGNLVSIAVGGLVAVISSAIVRIPFQLQLCIALIQIVSGRTTLILILPGPSIPQATSPTTL